MKKLNVIFFTLLFVFIFSACEKIDIPFEVQEQMAQLPDEIDYNFKVKQILSDKCFACHGPDSKKQKANLRLDISDIAYAHKGEDGYKAIKPGSIAKSDLVRRILSDDPHFRMPTPESNLALTSYEKAVLIKWVEQGAKYKPHWAYVAPEKAAIPDISNPNWKINNAVDPFVYQKLEEQDLKPAPQADQQTLIRRLSFDIRGISPSVKEIKDFIADKSPKAYENLVDRFLASEHYGERMSTYWLDVSRFADSYGYLDDKHYDQSPWRTWVINAYNKNLPFDKFITWQLAGDLLPNPTQEQVLATGFNRNHKQNSEAGIIEEEFRVEYVTDRTNTLGASVMATTIGCAKCHDHKYDPVSQKDYYSLFAFFNSTFEKGGPNYGNNDMVAGPTLLLTKKEEEVKIQNFKKYISQLESDYKLNQDKATTVAIQQGDKNIESSLQKMVLAKLSFDKTNQKDPKRPFFINEADPSINANFRNAEFGQGVSGQSLKYNDETMVAFPPEKIGNFERYQPFSFSLWLKVPENYPLATVFHKSDYHRYGYQGYDLVLKNNQLNFRVIHNFPHDAISVLSPLRLKTNKWYHIAISYNGNSKANGVEMFVNGEKQTNQVEYDHLVKHIKSFYSIHKGAILPGFVFGLRTLDRSMPKGEVDEFYLFSNTLNQPQAKFLFQQKQFPLKGAKEDFAKLNPLLYDARKQLADLYDSVQEVMVMGDLPKPRPTYVLNRGLYTDPTTQVFPNTPSAILPYPDHLPKNRYGLAQWLFMPNHPLTSRVAVNRIWQMIFGDGFVKTSDDFGNQGAMPSHPALLDYLAVWYRENGWNTKALQKLIFMSAVYQQSSLNDAVIVKKDPQNIYLSRSPRYRYPAEMIRDNALAVSNLLVQKIGGPSVYPYQPADLWEQITDKVWRYKYLQTEGEGLYRKSIYTIRKRTTVVPFLQIFDAADRTVCTVKRTVSSSPMQSLAILNNPQMIEASMHIALRMMNEAGLELKDKLNFGFFIITGRYPNLKELNLLAKMYTTERTQFTLHPDKANKLIKTGYMKPTINNNIELASFASIAMALMNTDEFLTRK